MGIHILKLSTEEVFEIIQTLKNHIDNNSDKDLLSAFDKLNSSNYKDIECNTCKEEKATIAFGQCDDCFEKEMQENGSVIYHE
tara:strand:- start:202 stop:450 length:249 start_codon:yes stop_codon:yes gene_type:complete